MKGKGLQPRLSNLGWMQPNPCINLYLASLSFRLEEEIKNFLDKQKPEYSNTTPNLKEILKGLL